MPAKPTDTASVQYFSQVGQDRFLDEVVFEGREGGTFVDVGAHDGKQINNSYFFEHQRGWTGICIEPLPHVYARLKANRSCICIAGAISNETGTAEFLKVAGAPEMLSGLLHDYHPEHLDRIQRELSASGGDTERIPVATYRLADLFEEHGIEHVDFCSIDTEGSELKVVQSIDYQKVQVDFFIIENNYQQTDVERFLKSHGYRKVERVEWDDVYAHPAVLDDWWRRKRARDPRVQRLARLGPLPGAAAAALALAAAALGVAPSLALPLTSVFVSLTVLGFWARRVVAG